MRHKRLNIAYYVLDFADFVGATIPRHLVSGSFDDERIFSRGKGMSGSWHLNFFDHGPAKTAQCVTRCDECGV